MDGITTILLSVLAGAVVSGLATFLALRVSIEHRLTKLETRFDHIQCLERFMEQNGELTLVRLLQERGRE